MRFLLNLSFETFPPEGTQETHNLIYSMIVCYRSFFNVILFLNIKVILFDSMVLFLKLSLKAPYLNTLYVQIDLNKSCRKKRSSTCLYNKEIIDYWAQHIDECELIGLMYMNTVILFLRFWRDTKLVLLNIPVIEFIMRNKVILFYTFDQV